MSSATSTSTSTRAPGDLGQTGASTGVDATLRPWQFFLLAGMLSATAVVIVATGQSAASIIVLSLTVVAASLVAVGAHRALAPLVLPASVLEASTLIGGRSRAGLEREKTLVLRTIKELEFDFAMGKMSRTDYEEMGGRLRARAIGLIRQLDAGGYKGAIEQELQIRMGTGATNVLPSTTNATPLVAPPTTAGGTNKPSLTVAQSAGALPPSAAATSGEAAFGEPRRSASRGGGAKAEVPPSTMDDTTLVAPISEGVTLVAPIPSTTATACNSCGGLNDSDARFCKHCGSKLSA